MSFKANSYQKISFTDSLSGCANCTYQAQCKPKIFKWAAKIVTSKVPMNGRKSSGI